MAGIENEEEDDDCRAARSASPGLTEADPSCGLRGVVYLSGVDWQQVVALGIVAIAAGLLLWRWLRPRKRFSGRAGACCGALALPPQGSIVFHARKGERRQIIIRSP